MNDGLLSIGQFARLVRLSAKQLRAYADLGLLRPARVDPASGYRYYRPEQAREALSIALLRSLDVPLGTIGEVLEGRDPAAALAGVRDRLDDELARRRRALTALDRILADGLPTAEVTLRRVEPERVAVVRGVAGSPRDVGRTTAACVAALRALMGGRTGRLTGVLPVELGESVPVTVAAPLPAGCAAPTGLTADVLPGGLFATTVHTGPYDQIVLTSHAALARCLERGHRPDGPLREVYLTDPATTEPGGLVTELLIPLEEPL
ncbi:MerR family transcriptional regulator [Streptomyces sp. RFCAC02]|uniref:MerR family transcriptional regulator n=1 Tax=Streptomyces sp. RFCAC02 TaxID=2499143 RepID=UPI00101F578A|nr:MerR family transcriptional regulator [Streptomyces sp. RFCAC02]